MSEEAPRDPMRLAQENMRAPVLKRVYTDVGVGEADGGWALLLDGRAARTPGKAKLIAPRRAIAQGMAEEWAGQGPTIDPTRMPITRLANSAIDGVAKTLRETRAEIAGYGGTDLLCYRADEPLELARRQAAAFDPVLAWAADALGARFILSASIQHVAQPERTLAAVRAAVEAYDEPFAVAALSVLTSLSGSALLALALAHGALDARDAWRAAHVDEDFQIEKWGEDDEASARRAARARDFMAAARVMRDLS